MVPINPNYIPSLYSFLCTRIQSGTFTQYRPI